MRKKEKWMMLLLTGTLVLTGAGIQKTYSYFTQREVVQNVFTVGDLLIDIDEPEWNPEEGDGEDIYPGYTVYKNPIVRNAGDGDQKTQPCYLLMRVKALDPDGTLITDQERLALIRKTIRYDASYTGSWGTTGTCSGLTEGRIPGYSFEEIEAFPMVNPEFDELTGDEGEWVFGYKGGKDMILQVNEEKILFTNVVIPTEWTEKEMEQLGDFQLEIWAEAIQASGFAGRTEAFEALRKQN